MAKVTPREAAEKLARNLKASIPDITRGVQRVAEAPSVKAVKAKQKMVNRWNEKINDGSWERATAAVSKEQWQAAMLDKGVNRIATGIDGALDKTTKFYEEFLPFLDGVASTVNAMPDVTIEDSIARMTEQVRRVSQFRRRS